MTPSSTISPRRDLELFFLVLAVLLCSSIVLPAQSQLLDSFEQISGWEFIRSESVDLSLTSEPGFSGKAIRFDYHFQTGTGYGGIQKFFPIDLPENFEISFYLKADSPPNNFEIKLIDYSGENVWWVNNRSYDFPEQWKKIRIKPRHITFAWGPTSDHSLKRIDRIEFTVASHVGGKGTLWIDELRFEPLPPKPEFYPIPIITSSDELKGHPASTAMDGDPATFWMGRGKKELSLLVDFQLRREFGGIDIRWKENFAPEQLDIFLSEDGISWENTTRIRGILSNRSFIRMAEAEARLVKLVFVPTKEKKQTGISEISFLDVEESLTANDFLIYMAKHSPPGDYPRYFLQQASYWTISGVNGDTEEALLNEDGMVEILKGRFSVEPMIKLNGKLYNWESINATQSLGLDGSGLPFIPSVEWNADLLRLKISLASAGEANSSSSLHIQYQITNTSPSIQNVEFYLLVRPFQVNPYYQFLNLMGGAGSIRSIREARHGMITIDDKALFLSRGYNYFGVLSMQQGNPAELIRQGKFPKDRSLNDPSGMAWGILRYKLTLKPGESRNVNISAPYHETIPWSQDPDDDYIRRVFSEVSDYWQQRLSHIHFHLPETANPILQAYKANLYYILVNRDRAGIQPGSRSYERSWIRDGSLTSSALLKSGFHEEVREFIQWFAPYQFDNGKVPCVVDVRGPDPVPEHDSHGQLIYLIREYFNFTGDTTFLRSMNHHVLKAVDYIESLIAQRSTDHFRYGNDSIRAYYGLVTESISHEGYSAKPMHSYWDNFFTIKGLKDAAEIQRVLNEHGHYQRISALRDTFEVNLYRSLQLAMKVRNIDYIPGCVELGDFDPTSTTIALTPCNELHNLPKPQVFNTFDKYYKFFTDRRDGKISWVNFTPYENRLIGSFFLLGQRDRAYELIEFFLQHQRPAGWHHWAEVVWHDYREPRFIGDMPHTWVGSDFINAIRNLFVFEDEAEQCLWIADGIHPDWLNHPEGISVEHLPTYYGDISYSISRKDNQYHFSITGPVKPPAGGIRVGNPNPPLQPSAIFVNGIRVQATKIEDIRIKNIPAEILIQY